MRIMPLFSTSAAATASRNSGNTCCCVQLDTTAKFPSHVIPRMSRDLRLYPKKKKRELEYVLARLHYFVKETETGNSSEQLAKQAEMVGGSGRT